MSYAPDHATSWLLLSALAFIPGTAIAEVSDKEPTISLFWTVGLTAAMLCLFAARLRPWLGVLFFATVAFWFIGLLLEIHSPDVGPYLRLEQGTVYYIQAYAAFAVVLFGLIVGLIWRRRSSMS
ncbi:hypothetical protein [Massilia agri]|uniref:Integron gene cassette protein n=1 Tax=Massilia agri TaxID=1886785 RepID=A0ABT2AGU6_9BURK|nr:hypothetical protein [Massilia agri]MCS0595459.1 hypothetical protein [Massilia agri]